MGRTLPAQREAENATLVSGPQWGNDPSESRLLGLRPLIKLLNQSAMGRTYWYECSKCGYRAQVSGKPDRGLNFFVQTIACTDCKALYDAVTRLRVPDETNGMNCSFGLNGLNFSLKRRSVVPPSFQLALNRLPYKGVRNYKWLQFKPQCPVSPTHRVENWTENDKCPRCGLFLDKNALPYRIWE
jgi:hypothetical protein